MAPQVTWGTRPDQVAPITGRVPDPAAAASDATRDGQAQALTYMGLAPGTPIDAIDVDRVFIGSCTNARIEDLREAARVARGHRVASSVRAMVVPGSQQVKRAAEAEGLDQVFTAAGFEWREPGCSMCLGMNDDVLAPGPALRLDQQPQLRRPAGPRRTHPPGQPGDGRRGRDPRPLHRRARLGLPLMEPFRTHTGLVAPLVRRDIDTDQIIPKQFLKRLGRTGFADALFYDWRVGGDGAPRADFVLNQPRYRRRVDPAGRRQFRLRLVARARRLGAARLRVRASSWRRGSPTSSRATPWPTACWRRASTSRPWRRSPAASRRRRATPRPSTSRPSGCAAATGSRPAIGVDPETRRRLLEGLDDIGLILQHEAAIRRYEATHWPR